MNNSGHEVKLMDRSILSMSGINKVESFNENEFNLISSLGPVHIMGEGLELLTLDTINNNIKIKGNIKGILYVDKTKKKKEESILSKLFK